MLHAELRVVGGKQQGKVIPLNVKKFLIGREEDCQLRPNSDLVSRHHCVFTNDDFTVRLRDLGSTNGTFVNGERLQGQVALKDGDQVQIGKLSFQVVVREVAAAQPAPVPEPAIIDGGDGFEQLADADDLASSRSIEMDSAAIGPTSNSDSAVLGFQEPPLPASDSDTHMAGSPHGGGDDTTIVPPPQQPPLQQPQFIPQPVAAGQQFSAAQLLAVMQQLAAGQLGSSDTALGMPLTGPVKPAAPPKVVMAPVVLPPPEETGAPEPKPPGSDPKKADAGKNPSSAAADIIRMHSNRRPT